MSDALVVYFDGEKYAGLLLAGVALAFAIAATVMFRARADLRSFALTLGLLALVQISAAVLLAFDLIAERRSAVYLDALHAGAER